MRYAEVILALKHSGADRCFDYIIPEGMNAPEAGQRVLAPFGAGNKPTEGYVISVKDETAVPREKLKALIAVKDDYPLFSADMMRLAEFMRRKYYTTLGSCLGCILPPGIELAPLVLSYAYLAEGVDYNENEFSGKQSEIIRLLKKRNGVSVAELTKTLGITRSPINTLAKKGLIALEPVEKSRLPFKSESYEPFLPHELLPKQQEAFDRLVAKLEPDYSGKKTVLLHGVTGSGKTEIYMRLIDELIKRGRQAIMLVPEISLTPQTVKSFVGRFSDKVSVTHSRLSAGERFDQWKRAREGEISVMIGPRSAVFTPFSKLGVIIIDEEHETSYKSEISPKYCVKELADELSRLTGCIVLLGSATPSVETYYRAETGKIDLIELNERVNKSFPSVEIIDMRLELALGNKTVFGDALRNAIAENLERKELSILFLNRRGHSTFVSCRACGNVLSCPDCSINYTYHIAGERMSCHYCGRQESVPQYCPVCGSLHIKYFGAGTQKIEQEISASFPSARILRMDLDTTSKKNSHERIYRSFLNGEADILIGTQMIAKGLDFPKVTLVGIIAADISIHMGDFRSAEKAYQLITQVSGRAGRAQFAGRVFIQSYNPEHYSIQFSMRSDYKGFYTHEISLRKQMQYPPFTHLFCVLLSGEDERKVVTCIIKLSKIMAHYAQGKPFDLLAPTPAVISKLNKNYRHKLIIKAYDEERLKNFVFYCMKELAKNEDLGDITVNLTLDPLNIP